MASPTTIGPFEILAKLGSGGMGVVYKANDKRLNRLVALKLLPEGAGPAARERFQREAMAIAALNHPHICTLYEVGFEGQPYLVMELLEGETLYAKLAAGRVSATDAMTWGAEIADALQAAHTRGILHRDLKPANIFITQRGSAKVLDFGLAQFAPSSIDADALTIAGHQAANQSPLTTPGATLGTYAYMSPEQARGEPTDARSDIFSLGVVLYEMASGEAPFQGRTSADISAAILTRTPPPPSSVRDGISTRFDDIVAQCLEKSPDLRFQSAADLRVGLRRLPGSTTGSSPSGIAATVGSGAPITPARSGIMLAAIGAAILLIAGLAYWWFAARTTGPPELTFRQLTFSGLVEDGALSPDGKFLAHIDDGPDGTSLHLMSVANASDTQIVPPETGCCQSPTFSPDGSMIYFKQVRALRAVPVLGGTVRTLANNVCSGAGVSPDGKHIAYLSEVPRGDALTIADASGAGARVLIDPRPEGYYSNCWMSGPLYPDAPAWSPDGQRIAVESSGSDNTKHIVLVAAKNGQVQTLPAKLDTAASDLAWLSVGDGILFTAHIPGVAPPQLWEITVPGGRLVRLTDDLQGYDRVTVVHQAAWELALLHAQKQFSVWRQKTSTGAFEQLPGGGANQDGALGIAWLPDDQILSLRQLGEKSQLAIEGGPNGARIVPTPDLPEFLSRPIIASMSQFVVSGYNEAAKSMQLWRVDNQGGSALNLTPDRVGELPAMIQSAQGPAVAFYTHFQKDGVSQQQVWSVPLAGGTPKPLWSGDIFNNFVLGMPDHRHVLVLARVKDVSLAANRSHFEEISADGRAPLVLPLNMIDTWACGKVNKPYGVTPDGRAFTAVISRGLADNIWAFPFDASAPYALTHFTDLRIAAYAFAPDGKLAISRGTANSDVVLATALGGASH